MKRITLLLLSFSIIAATAFAQNSVSGGISAGVNYSKVSAGDNSSGGSYDWKWKWGPVG